MKLLFLWFSDTEKKTTLDQALRGVLGDQIVSYSLSFLCSVAVCVCYWFEWTVTLCRMSWRTVLLNTCLSFTWVLTPWQRVRLSVFRYTWVMGIKVTCQNCFSRFTQVSALLRPLSFCWQTCWTASLSTNVTKYSLLSRRTFPLGNRWICCIHVLIGCLQFLSQELFCVYVESLTSSITISY